MRPPGETVYAVESVPGGHRAREWELLVAGPKWAYLVREGGPPVRFPVARVFSSLAAARAELDRLDRLDRLRAVAGADGGEG